MRKSTPDAAITSSATGTISRSGSGAGSDASPARSPSHCATLKTVKRLRRSEEHTSELQSLMRISYAVFCLKKKKKTPTQHNTKQHNYTKSTRIIQAKMITLERLNRKTKTE